MTNNKSATCNSMEWKFKESKKKNIFHIVYWRKLLREELQISENNVYGSTELFEKVFTKNKKKDKWGIYTIWQETEITSMTGKKNLENKMLKWLGYVKNVMYMVEENITLVTSSKMRRMESRKQPSWNVHKRIHVRSWFKIWWLRESAMDP